MQVQLKNNRRIILTKLMLHDLGNLSRYLQTLSAETRQQFGPHLFDEQSLLNFYQDPLHIGYLAFDTESTFIVGYAVVREGILSHDWKRLAAYGLQLNQETDCTYAPSVADAWQGLGVGKALLDFTIEGLQEQQRKRIILWGGVQATNDRAIRYYENNGFSKLGAFEYNGLNWDMVSDISTNSPTHS